ncbi:MAG: hypothetical protein JW744_05960 [Candidatus Diapherotrites archaeon]|uniref:Class III signal peptide-containing protein n=1 Tax=Candidatus Iainarchaeum sp. TaxID=3101447 RepID=A0A938YUW8_9ARCH|nr:hypothetical protein [Candidatus Diapherotrites archaeon]
MKLEERAQASIEMLLLIGVAVAIAATVGILLKQAATGAAEQAPKP